MPTRPLSDDELKLTLDTLEKHEGNKSQTAKELGIKRSTLRHRLKLAENRSPLDTCSEGQVVGTSTLYGPDGETKLVWEKRKKDPVRESMERIEEILAGIEPLGKIEKPEGTRNEDLLAFYPVADAHIGQLSWGKETGADWDCKIASKTVRLAVDSIMASMPDADTGYVVFLGDSLNHDGLDPVTPTSRHIVDSDGRFERIVDVSIEVIMHAARRALEKHRKVVLNIAEGNHDLASSVWLRKLFKHVFQDNPRIEVVDTPKPYYGFVWGENFIGVTHGHLRGVKSPAELITAVSQEPEFKRDWGNASYCTIHTGHKHYWNVNGSKGAIIEQHPTLAARSAWAARLLFQGYRAMHGIVYQKKGGEKTRVSFYPDFDLAA